MNIKELRNVLNTLPSEYDDVEVRADVGSDDDVNLWLHAFTPIPKGRSGYEMHGEFVLHFTE
jgi:hypothetical protein